ncbi:MAG: hypothetical protein QOH60_2913 [Mycobacterium sp.]|jgi:hypothetical protein|nr:hypothetical protein [Mycobacterium sp.]
MSKDEKGVPDVDQLTRSMLLVHGAHDDDDHAPRNGDSALLKPSPPAPEHAAALRHATQQDRDRYLNSGLQPVDCRFCHVSVLVKKLGPEHTSVQWNSEATQRCAYFAEVRESGGQPARSKSCPRLADSIEHAIAEGVLEPASTAPSPGDG